MDKKDSSNKLRLIFSFVLGLIGLGLLGFGLYEAHFRNTADQPVAALPAPQISSGILGEQFGVDEHINVETIDNYLNRDDTVYRDMRLLVDPGNYEAIGGDRYLSGYVEGFEIIPLPYIVNVTGLPEAVGATYAGPTLFTEKNGEYVANYKESLRILEDIFPKDKNILLMCGGAGYAGMTKTMLIKLGWDEGKIYNVGGYWNYEGSHNVTVKYDDNGEAKYAFWKVPYHMIDFTTLTRAR